jgi:hypothetical protein
MPDEDTDVEFVLTMAGKALRGRVVDANDSPVASAVVRVTNVSSPGVRRRESYVHFGDAGPLTVQSANDGRFALERFGTDTWVNVKISADGYADLGDYFDPRQTGDREKTFQLLRAGAIAGNVVVQGEGAVTGKVFVSATLARLGGEERTLGTHGSFEIKGLKPGDYTLTARLEGTNGLQWVCPKPPVVKVRPDATTHATIELARGIPVRGKLFKAGTKVVPAGRKTVYVDSGPLSVPAEVKEDGSWRMYLYEGTFDLRYYVQGMSEAPRVRRITVSRDTPAEELILELE